MLTQQTEYRFSPAASAAGDFLSAMLADVMWVCNFGLVKEENSQKLLTFHAKVVYCISTQLLRVLKIAKNFEYKSDPAAAGWRL